MRRTMALIVAAFAVLGMLWSGAAIPAAMAEETSTDNSIREERQRVIEAFKERYGANWQFAWDDVRNCALSLDGHYNSGRSISSEEAAKNLASEFLHNSREVLKIATADLKPVKVHLSEYLNRYRITYQQYHQNIRVETGRVHVYIRPDGDIYAVRNGFYPGIEVSTSPTITEEDAISIAERLYTSRFGDEETPDVELVIYPVTRDSFINFFLSWKVQYIMNTFFIDAQKGIEIERWQNYKYQHTYSGTIRGTTYPLTDPMGAASLEPLQYLYIWLDEPAATATAENKDTETNAAGFYTITLADPAATFYTKLYSGKTRVYNFQTLQTMDHEFAYGAVGHNYDFPASVGHQANVHYNLIRAWNQFNSIHTHNQPFIPAFTNDNTLAPGVYGESYGTSVYYGTGDVSRYSCILQHEFTHCVVFNVNGGWINPVGGEDWDCLDEGFCWYYPCAFNGNSHYVQPGAGEDWDLSTTVNTMIEDLNPPPGTLNEADHSHYWNQKAVAAAWWDLRGSLTAAKLHSLLWTALDQLPDAQDHPRDFFNQMLIADDDDGKPRNGTPNVDKIDAAYRRHGMNYWPKVQSVDALGFNKDKFDWLDEVYCKGEGLPTNQEVHIYVVDNVWNWADGAALADVSGGHEVKTTDGNGIFPATKIWDFANWGEYDIIVDVDRNGKFDFGFDGIIDGSDGLAWIGFVVWGYTAVELISFEAIARDGEVLLEWKTCSEVGNFGFHIERSQDAVTFERISEDIIPGASACETENSYAYVDRGLTNGIPYYYNLITVDMDGVEEVANESPVEATPTAHVPAAFALHQNYPNPFNPVTEIIYAIPRDEHVTVKVYNVQGAEVATLVDAHQKANFYTVRWDADGLASGVYFCRLQAGEFSKTIKMILLK